VLGGGFMKSLWKGLPALAVLALMFAASPASAAIVPISNPGDPVPGGTPYTSWTTVVPFPASGTFTSITDGILTVGFSTTMTRFTHPGSWLTWSSAPFSEFPGVNPLPLGYSPATSLTMTLSTAVDTFGFELEPNPFAVFSFTADFFEGATLLGSITRSVDGTAGARLFAGFETSGARITRVVVTGPADFAIAQVRYHLPEPASLIIAGMVGVGLCGGYLARRRKVTA
jgi:hypothetical protein